MEDSAWSDSLFVRVGELTRMKLLEALKMSGVQLNDFAITLLDDVVFDNAAAETVQVVVRTVRDLGLTDGATLTRLVEAAERCGLVPCPPATGPYLRLAMLDQKAAPDSVMSNGRAPSGSVTVASAPLRDDDDYPKGFYLRVVDGVPWLRGYQCSDQHTWSPQDRLAFRTPRVSGKELDAHREPQSP